LQLTLKDVSLWNAGLILFGHNEREATDLSYGKRSELIDHGVTHGVDGLVTMVGVRFTTSRCVAEKAVDLVFRKLGKEKPKSWTATTRISGGQLSCFDEFLQSSVEKGPPALPAETMRALVYNHGSEYRKVLQYVDENPVWGETLPGSTTIKAEVAYAVDREMAQRLGDVVFRRTDLGTGGNPGEAALRACADIMAPKLGWDQVRVQKEMDEVRTAFPFQLRQRPLEHPSRGGVKS
jgi:glycerol-3-phosphate dehydrogenase